MTAVHLPADQASLRVYHSTEPEDPEFTVDSLLPHLGLGATECDINGYVLPMHTSLQQFVCPSLESADSKWVAWDTPLDATKRLHLMVCDRELFIAICHYARVHNWVIHLGGGPPAHRTLTHVELHCLPPTEAVEVLGRMHRSLCHLRDEVALLKAEVRLLRRTFGSALENLAAEHEELAPLVGLVAPPHIQDEDAMDNTDAD